VATTLITPVRNRLEHLSSLVRGLEACDPLPDEFVVVRMGGADPSGALAGCPVPSDVVHAEGEELPLASARNIGADRATGDDLVFLDVDCVPGPNLFGEYAGLLGELDALAVGKTRYLSETGELVEKHPRPFGERFEVDESHDLFWSLNFAIRRATFWGTVGGFDERYAGYGVEDTDFAMAAREVHLPMAWCRDAIATHLHHPPTRLDPAGIPALVRNARLFHRKWGFWPAAGWLEELSGEGLLRWDQSLGTLEPASAS
jgi:N-acetylglucosaminyl-diphospho-decaprenol L-rhamnosyltransferase